MSSHSSADRRTKPPRRATATAKPNEAAAVLGNAVDYLPLVQQVARRLGRRLPAHIVFEDLVGAGVLGLLEAMQRFDPQRATAFAKYAEFRIKGAILDELRRNDMMARDARSEVKRIEAVMDTLSKTHGEPPSEALLASALGCSLSVLRDKLQRLVPVRLNSFEEQPDNFVTAESSPFDLFSHKQHKLLLAQSIARLNEKQQQVLQLYYIEELTLREIGVVLEVSESRICQIMAAATLQLRVLCRQGKNDG